MTVSEMRRVLADIRMGARQRLQEIREQMELLKAEANELQELIDG